jgi:electron transport complex protein RnfG
MRALTMVAAVAGFLIVLVYQWTLPIITKNKEEALKKAIFSMRPETRRTVYFLVDGERLLPIQEMSGKGKILYAGYNEDGHLTGVWAEAAGMGYQDKIRLLFAIDPRRQSIIGMAVLESKETPGLGDRIEKDERFQTNFVVLDARLNNQGTGLEHEILTVKEGRKQQPWEIDGITGATISSKAVGRILNRAAGQTMPQVVRNLDQLNRGGK